MKTILNTLFVQIIILISVSQTFAQNGCTDPLANNYDSLASINDGSCLYDPANLTPISSTTLSNDLNENSGLILWDNELWTHQDGGNTTDIFSISTLDLTSFSALNISGISNIDWEDIAQDETYVYLGDFGNNANGNRSDLKIYRITKASINAGTPAVDVINFSYSDQTDFTPQGGNNTDFDCEAFIVSDTSIFLFTKEWISQKTTVYSMPKTPGTYSAINEGNHDVNGLITGATYLKDKQLVVLSGYSAFLQPFMYLLYDFSGDYFLAGNKRKINLDLSFHQVEGIATQDGLNYFLSNEFFTENFPIIGTITTQPQIHNVNLNDFLLNYLGYETSGNSMNFDESNAWVPGVVPPLASDITIAHDLSLNQNYTAKSLEIKEGVALTTNSNYTLSSEALTLNANGDLILESGAVLSVSGNIHNDGNLYFKGDETNGSAQFDSFNDIISGTGEVTVERFIPAKRAYRLLSSPVTTTDFIFENWQESGSTPSAPDGLGMHITGGLAADGFDQSGTNNPSMFTFDNTNSNGTPTQDDDWSSLANTNATKLFPGQPYLTFVRGDRSIDITTNSSPANSTTLRAAGDLFIGSNSPTLSTTVDHFSLVANPYQAIIDYTLVARTDLTDFIYVWDASVGGANGKGGYVTVDVSNNSISDPNPTSSDANNFIAPGMAFFVQNPASGTISPSLTINEDDKATGASEVTVFNTYPYFYINSRLYKTTDFQNGDTETDALGLRLSDSFMTPADEEDATKLLNPDENYAIINNGLRSIDKQATPALGHEVDLSITNYGETNYSLTFVIENKPTGLGVFLKDNYLNTQTELTESFVYDFTVDASVPGSTAENRFSLLFDSTTLGLGKNTFGTDFSLYPNPSTNGQFSIRTPNLSGAVNVKITSLLGQVVYAQNLNTNDYQVSIDAQNLASGVYIVSLTQGNQSYQTKWIVE